MDVRHQLGQQGEHHAARFLQHKNFTLLHHNWRSPHGEIDLIMRDTDGTLVFVEVKTRRSIFAGWPEEAITSTKLEHLRNAIDHFLTEQSLYQADWRLDIVAVIIDQDQAHVRHYHNWHLS